MATSNSNATAEAPDISVVIPVKDEAANIRPLLDEIAQELTSLDFEVVVVDDGSRDGTDTVLAEASAGAAP